MKKNDIVRIIAPVPQGEVLSIKFDENTGEKRVLMTWIDANGVSQERWFPDSELEVVTSYVAPVEPDPVAGSATGSGAEPAPEA